MRLRLRLLINTAALTTLLASGGLLYGQFTSAIEGTVTDPSRAVIPGAVVTLTNVNTGIVQAQTTSAVGYYRFPSLSASDFKLSVASQGFKTSVLPQFRLQVGQTRTVNVALELGTASTAVTVTEITPPIETSEGRVSGVINTENIADLPVVGRNFYALVVQTPGVTGLPSGGGQAYAQATSDVFNPEYGVNLNANGMRSEQNGFNVDSGSVTSMVRHGVVNLIPNAESVQELRVSANDYSAENGGNAGAQVSVITKQGTNTWHGSASWFHTNNALQSRNEFQSSVPAFRRNEGTWSLGGPIFKNKTFVFGSMDVLRSGVAQGFVINVPTADFISWMSQNRPNNISTHLLNVFPSDVVPARNFTTAGSLLGLNCSGSTLINTPAGSMPCNLPVTGEGNFSLSLPRNGLQWNTRVDHMLTEKDRLYVNFYRNVLDQIFGTLFGAPGASAYPAFRPNWHQYTEYANVNETHTFAPTLVNEAASTFTRLWGLIPCNNCSVPNMGIIGMANYGGPGDVHYVQNNYEWRDGLSWINGAHTLKFGGAHAVLQSNFDPTRDYQRPYYFFNSVLDFAADKPFTESNIGFNPTTGSVYVAAVTERQHLTSFYGQDAWKLKPNLSLTFGLRWEFFGKVSEPTGVTNVVFQGGNDFSSLIANGKNDVVPYIFQNPDKNNFAPRFSFAWDPTNKGKMSIRGGAGIFYDVYASQLYGGSHFAPPIYSTAVASQLTPPFVPAYGLGQSDTSPYGFPRPASLQVGLDPKNGLLGGKAGLTWVDPNMRTSYTQNWFFGVQYSLAPTWTVEADYMGSLGRKLYARYDVNRFAGDLIQNNGVLTRLNTSFGPISYAQSNLNSEYNGGAISLQKRYSHGLVFQAGYTFGRAIDFASGFNADSSAVDVTNLKLSRGPASFNVSQKLAFNVVWDLPTIPSGSELVKRIVGGWQLSTATILQSGTPFSVYCSTPFIPVRDSSGKLIGNSGCDFNADGANNDFPNAPAFSGIQNISRSAYLNGVFKASDFPVPVLGQSGNLGRNSFIGPGYANSDIALLKTARVKWFMNEHATLQLRAEAFNAFNRVNLAQLNGDMASPFFGRSTYTFPSRNFQFGLRLSF
jgi:hypothetical protein